jgi:hypothetical protein
VSGFLLPARSCSLFRLTWLLDSFPSDVQVFVHVTPYQYESKDRPWIKSEVKEFLNHMSFLGGDVQLMM